MVFGEIIYLEGFVGEFVIFLIIDGKVELFMCCEDKCVIVVMFGCGEFFGELVLFVVELCVYIVKVFLFC